MDGKLRFTYNDIHLLVESKVPIIDAFKPDVIIAIGTGGFIPARMLKKHIKLPFYAVIIKLYDDVTDQIGHAPEKVQWLTEEQQLWMKDKRVLIVDEIDDTRKTLSYCAREIKKYAPEQIAVFVVHNKLKQKEDELDDDIVYLTCANIPDKWVIYPWEADNILDHDKRASEAHK
jgi:hypoxanthine phosphoribosyltransferase